MKTNLENLRIKAGYRSARDFAIKHNLSVATYNRYENGSDMPLSAAVKIAQALNVSLDELVGVEHTITLDDKTMSALLQISAYWQKMSLTSRKYLLTIAKTFSEKGEDDA